MGLRKAFVLLIIIFTYVATSYQSCQSQYVAMTSLYLRLNPYHVYKPFSKNPYPSIYAIVKLGNKQFKTDTVENSECMCATWSFGKPEYHLVNANTKIEAEIWINYKDYNDKMIYKLSTTAQNLFYQKDRGNYYIKPDGKEYPAVYDIFATIASKTQ